MQARIRIRVLAASALAAAGLMTTLTGAAVADPGSGPVAQAPPTEAGIVECTDGVATLRPLTPDELARTSRGRADVMSRYWRYSRNRAVVGPDSCCTARCDGWLCQALVEAGAETELVVYPREGHGWRERDHQLDVGRRELGVVRPPRARGLTLSLRQASGCRGGTGDAVDADRGVRSGDPIVCSCPAQL